MKNALSTSVEINKKKKNEMCWNDHKVFCRLQMSLFVICPKEKEYIDSFEVKLIVSVRFLVSKFIKI